MRWPVDPHGVHIHSLLQAIDPTYSITGMLSVAFGWRALTSLIVWYQLQGLNKPKTPPFQSFDTSSFLLFPQHIL